MVKPSDSLEQDIMVFARLHLDPLSRCKLMDNDSSPLSTFLSLLPGGIFVDEDGEAGYGFLSGYCQEENIYV